MIRKLALLMASITLVVGFAGSAVARTDDDSINRFCSSPANKNHPDCKYHWQGSGGGSPRQTPPPNPNPPQDRTSSTRTPYIEETAHDYDRGCRKRPCTSKDWHW